MPLNPDFEKLGSALVCEILRYILMGFKRVKTHLNASNLTRFIVVNILYLNSKKFLRIFRIPHFRVKSKNLIRLGNSHVACSFH